jgi:hypothetical protein
MIAQWFRNNVNEPRRRSLFPLFVFFLWILVVENLLIILWAVSVGRNQEGYTFYAIYGMAMLASGAASFGGGFIGFLFGIPRSTFLDAESSPPGQAIAEPGRASRLPARSGLRVNTNLESVSDALTKALLGIGLTQMYKAGDWARDLAAQLGPSFGPGIGGKIVALSTLIYGAAEGFFFGYLLTRIYLAPVFAHYDSRTAGQD